ncbi:hypothetical protein ATZ33_13740 [Enterococcus silesiacus]|uniref:Uncharacterized protein n=1 Tax=Enterococcus silesiacus TaxID=332949 RepID=A0A0S3KEE6_9ENTE|nr:hypothetical protein [Enterococcus silesiacus]ALS02409.1 hypothetical protein ATZ33_13740 [Enterococcus silesiacus]OJG88194.1 hypothetical protein RV15_GL001853 [Enterococcus silesiacus]
MNANKKKLTGDDFFYFSLTLNSSAIDLKSMKFFLWVAVCQIIVVPVYVISYGQEVLPQTGPLLLTYLFLSFISLFSLLNLLLFKTKVYEPMAYFMAGLLFLGIAFLLIIVGYTEFFMNHNDMEVFNTLNLSIIEHEKIILINRLILIPPISFILSSCFHLYAIKTGKTSRNHKKAKKYEQNSRNFSKILPLFFPLILMFVFLNNTLNIIQGNLMILLFTLSSVILSVFAPSLIVISYMKKKFPTIYWEKNMREEGKINI